MKALRRSRQSLSGATFALLLSVSLYGCSQESDVMGRSPVATARPNSSIESLTPQTSGAHRDGSDPTRGAQQLDSTAESTAEGQVASPGAEGARSAQQSGGDGGGISQSGAPLGPPGPAGGSSSGEGPAGRISSPTTAPAGVTEPAPAGLPGWPTEMGTTPPPTATPPTPTVPPIQSVNRSSSPSPTTPPTTPASTSITTDPLSSVGFRCLVQVNQGGDANRPVVNITVSEANRSVVWAVVNWQQERQVVQLNVSGGVATSTRLAPERGIPTVFVYGGEQEVRENLGCVSGTSP